MLVPLGASPTGGIGFEAVGEMLGADSTGSSRPSRYAPPRRPPG